MKILAFSDWGKKDPVFMEEILKRNQTIDLLVYSGDSLNRFYEDGHNRLSELAEYTSRGKALVVKGNDDEHSPKVFESDNVHNLHQEIFELGNYAFLGVEGAEIGKTTITEDKIKKQLEKQKEEEAKRKNKILVSHQPPYKILDIAQKFERKHVGSQVIRQFCKNEEIELVLCGHVHNQGGNLETYEDAKILNNASYFDKYSPNNFSIIELNENGIKCSQESTSRTECRKLSALPQASASNVRRFWDAGIESLEDISRENIDQLQKVVGAGRPQAELWINVKKAIKNEKITLRDKSAFEPLKKENLIFFDIETDLTQSIIWLIGAYSSKEEDFSSFSNLDYEENLLIEFREYLEEFTNPTLVYYGNNGFDEERFKASMKRYSIKIPESVAFYDLGKNIQWNLIGAFQKLSLKPLAKKLSGYDYQKQDISGIEAGFIFSRYLEEGIKGDWDKIKQYNRDDVLALKSLSQEIRIKLNSEY